MDRAQMEEAMATKRRYLLTGDITWQEVEDLTKFLFRANLESDSDEIILFVDSSGGMIEPALYMYDRLKSFRAPVTGVIMGRCMSAAVTVLLGCARRIASRHSRLLVHQVIVRSEFSLDEHYATKLQEKISWGQRYNDYVIQIYAEATGQPREKLQNLMLEGSRYETYMTSEEAKQFGFVHEVVDSYPIL